MNRRVLRLLAPSAVVAVLLLALAPPVAAQLRPLRPFAWEIFQPTNRALLRVGVGLLNGQRASLAGTEGRLLELGDYSVLWRTGSVALELSGTAVRRFDDRARWADPTDDVAPGLRRRVDAGDVTATTAVRLSPAAWPALVVLRFGASLPTGDPALGLDRGQTDFYGLLGLAWQRGPLLLGAEGGIGILGTRVRDFEQQDDFVYTARLAWQLPGIRPELAFTGQSTGLHYRHIRGNEDLREIRLGLRAGHRTWIDAQWVYGLIRSSPRSGLLLSLGTTLPWH